MIGIDDQLRDRLQDIRSDHHDIVLDAASLADPAVRRETIEAKDSPTGLGDMDNSLFLLFSAIRERSTVALSGESADEVFGGHLWYHDEEIVATPTFPWLAAMRRMSGGHSLARYVRTDFLSTLDVQSYVRDSYHSALAEVPSLPGEDAGARRMREFTYLHLTRLLPSLLERKDRMCMAAGLEVRVPFCDHRLIEYAYNTPWAMQSFDGREKSLLRAATKDVLPASVVNRVKSPYPSTQDPRYMAAVRDQVREVVADPPAGLFDIFDRDQVVAAASSDDTLIGLADRLPFERILDFAMWLGLRRPELKI